MICKDRFLFFRNGEKICTELFVFLKIYFWYFALVSKSGLDSSSPISSCIWFLCYLTGDTNTTLSHIEKLAKICQDSWNQWKDTGILEILSQTDNHQHTKAKRPSALARIYNDSQMD